MKSYAKRIVSMFINNELGKIQTLRFADIQEHNGYRLSFPETNKYLFSGIWAYSISKDELICYKSRDSQAPIIPIKEQDTIIFTMIGNEINCFFIAETHDCTVKMCILNDETFTGSMLSNLTSTLHEFEKLAA
tara:strand:+ start:1484 stop:1882 length:399 start_codon:yes stop_codon:yes gene_type:complete